VLREASYILSGFRERSERSKEVAAQHFTRSAGLTQRLATHTVQKHFWETAVNATDFIAMVREKVEGESLTASSIWIRC
jgi:hypothetical protein